VSMFAFPGVRSTDIVPAVTESGDDGHSGEAAPAPPSDGGVDTAAVGPPGDDIEAKDTEPLPPLREEVNPQVESFCGITGMAPEVATVYLTWGDDSLEKAMELFFERDGGEPTAEAMALVDGGAMLAMAGSDESEDAYADLTRFYPSTVSMFATWPLAAPGQPPAKTSQSPERSGRWQEVVRFATPISPKSDWHVSGSTDAICITVNRQIVLGGVRLIGKGALAYAATVQVMGEEGEVYTSGEVFSAKADEGGVSYSLYFATAIALVPQRTYHLVAKINGTDGKKTNTHNGTNGKGEITDEAGVTFTVSNSKHSNNGTDKGAGQIYGFLYDDAVSASVDKDLCAAKEMDVKHIDGGQIEVHMSGSGPKTILSAESTRAGVLKWKVCNLGNSSVEFGAVSAATRGDNSGLHKNGSVGICSSDTSGSVLQSVAIEKGVPFQVVVHANEGYFECLFDDVSKNVHMPLHFKDWTLGDEVWLAVTLWSEGTVRFDRPGDADSLPETELNELEESVVVDGSIALARAAKSSVQIHHQRQEIRAARNVATSRTLISAKSVRNGALRWTFALSKFGSTCIEIGVLTSQHIDTHLGLHKHGSVGVASSAVSGSRFPTVPIRTNEPVVITVNTILCTFECSFEDSSRNVVQPLEIPGWAPGRRLWLAMTLWPGGRIEMPEIASRRPKENKVAEEATNPLPAGWVLRESAEGMVYFNLDLEHGTRIDPRALMHGAAQEQLSATKQQNCNTSLEDAVRSGDMDAVKNCLAEGCADANAIAESSGETGKTLLMVAAEKGYGAVARALIDAGAQVSTATPKGTSALHFAAWSGSGDVIEVLLEHGAVVNARNSRGWTPLMYAVDNGQPTAAMLVLSHTKSATNVNACDSFGGSALLFAVRANLTRTAEALVGMGADVNVATKSGITPLIAAAAAGKQDMVSLLIASKAVLDTQTSDGKTALSAAVTGGHGQVVTALTNAGCKFDIPDANGVTPLLLAASNGHDRLAGVLVEAGADVHQRDATGRTALVFAAQEGLSALASALIAADADVNVCENEDGAWAEGRSPLMIATRRGHTDVAVALASAGADPNVQGVGTGLIPEDLSVCVRFEEASGSWSYSGSRDAVAFTADHDIVCGGFGVFTPKDASAGQVLCEALLLEGAGKDGAVLAKCDVHLGRPDAGEGTVRYCQVLFDEPVPLEASNEYSAVIKLTTGGLTSVRGSTKTFSRTVDGTTFKFSSSGAGTNGTSATSGNVPVIFFWSDSSYSLGGQTALSIAVKSRNSSIVSALVEAGAFRDCRDSDGSTPLMYAARAGLLDVAALLIEKGCDVNAASQKSGKTALILAAEEGHSSIVDLLVKANADKERRVHETASLYRGCTALLVAAQCGHTAVVAALAQAGADVNAEDKVDEASALLWAMKNGHSEAAFALIQAGANLDAYTSANWPEGQTALAIAISSDLHDLAIQMVNGGAILNSATKRKGSSALDLARRSQGGDELAGMLQSCADELQKELPRRLAAAAVKSGADFLTEARRVSALYYFVTDLAEPTDAEVASARASLYEHMIKLCNRDEDLEALANADPMREILEEFCDRPIETLRRWPSEIMSLLRVPSWLNKTVVAAVTDVIQELLEEECKTVKSDALIQEYIVSAQKVLADDRQIYTAAFSKMEHKHDQAAKELYGLAKDAVDVARSVWVETDPAIGPLRPPQPVPEPEAATVLDVKVHAAKSADFLEKFAKQLSEATGTVVCHVAPQLKKSFRMVQKRWVRGNVVSICDVSRALAEVEDFEQMKTAHTFMMQCGDIQLVDIKDRLNYPTSGGWADLVYLFRNSRYSADDAACDSTMGHIHEVQLVLKPMLVARKGMDTHAAYAAARHLLEVLQVLNVDVEKATGLTPNDDPTKYIKALEDEIRALRGTLNEVTAGLNWCSTSKEFEDHVRSTVDAHLDSPQRGLVEAIHDELRILSGTVVSRATAMGRGFDSPIVARVARDVGEAAQPAAAPLGFVARVPSDEGAAAP